MSSTINTLDNVILDNKKNLDKQVEALMLGSGVSLKTGFLAEEPLRYLPKKSDKEQSLYFEKIDDIAHSLESLIKEKKIAANVNDLKVPAFSFDKLTWPCVNRLMLVTSMLTHSYFREILPYKDVGELMKDGSIKHLPAQLAVPLWNLSKITGIAPSMSYGLYSLWNYYKKDPDLPISLDNIDMIHSFTGSLDEKWFVWIHQVVEATFGKAIPELLKAYILTTDSQEDEQKVIEQLINCLDKASEITKKTIDVLERMREHCDYKTYFDKVRLFYAFPKSVVFEGVDELGGKPQEIFGETGGQSPFMHFLLAVLGVSHGDDHYFPSMQKHMLKGFRELIIKLKSSKLREFVLAHKKNRKVARRYNMLINSVLEWRAEHISLVDDYIKVFGEIHGTGKPPLDWLRSLYNKTKTYLID